MPTIKELWATQLQEYPESIRLTKQEMLCWIGDATISLKEDRSLWCQFAWSLCQPKGVFYRTSDAPDAWVGFRYGTHGSEYSSNWPRWDYSNNV